MLALLDDVAAGAARGAALMEMQAPGNLSDIAGLAADTARTRGAPTDDAALLAAVLRLDDRVRARRLLALAQEARDARHADADTFKESAWDAEVAETAAALRAASRSWLRRLFGRHKQALAHLATLLKGDVPKKAATQSAIAERLLAYQSLAAKVAGEDGFARAAFGPAWRDGRADLGALTAALGWADGATEPAGAACPGAEAADHLAALARERSLDAFPAGPPALRERLGALADKLDYDWALALGADRDAAPLPDLRGRLGRLREGVTTAFQEWQEARRLTVTLSQHAPDLLTEVCAGEVAPDDASARFAYLWSASRWKATRADETLQAITPGRQAGDAATFASLDAQLKNAARAKTRAAHLAGLPGPADPGFAALTGELKKKSRLLPLRKLMERAGPAIQKTKPVMMMMSPVSVAQYLPPGKLRFDLMVIDEASQVRPEDALGAVARCDQIVVVGDQKQLPPTAFFDRLTQNDPLDDDDDEAMDGAVRATDTESILALCEARGVPPRMLEWHYRSRDPSLIAVSNDEFYDGRLILPPSPLQGDADYGLQLARADGIYDRGGRRTNTIEAQAVVDAAARHASERPDRSLGIVTFSSAQASEVEVLLEHARRQDPVLDAFLREGGEEDVFVKNIENVQGDERDVIFVSVGYGPELPGQPLRSQSFGPVNAEGGGRRLNVLFTRARLACRVFCSFDPGDIRTDAKNEGPRILRRFLTFAQGGILAQKAPTGQGFDSPFEADVAREIERMGYEVEPQVGTAGFRIDIGVRHPDHPGRFMLAVEADGATYHSGLWVRERDRLR